MPEPQPQQHRSSARAKVAGPVRDCVSILATRGLLKPHQVRAAIRLEHLSASVEGLHSPSLERLSDRSGQRSPEDSGLSAATQLREIKALLGTRNNALVIAVCVMGMSLRDLGKTRRERDFIVDTLRACLDDLATRWGYAGRRGRNP